MVQIETLVTSWLSGRRGLSELWERGNSQFRKLDEPSLETSNGLCVCMCVTCGIFLRICIFRKEGKYAIEIILLSRIQLGRNSFIRNWVKIFHLGIVEISSSSEKNQSIIKLRIKFVFSVYIKYCM